MKNISMFLLASLFVTSGCNKMNIESPQDDLNKIVNNDDTNIVFNNIENLYAQPLPVIQECVQGKWKFIGGYKWGYIGFIYPTNTIVNIDTENNNVVITANESPSNMIMGGALNGTSSCYWEEKEVYQKGVGVRPPCYSTYVMQFNELEPDQFLTSLKLEKIGWYFERIKNDTLSVVTYFTPIEVNFSYYQSYLFVKIRNNETE